MSVNNQSLARRSLSIEQQKPLNYFKFNDEYPKYRFVQRITAANPSVNGLGFTARSVDPNMFLSARATLKVSIEMKNSEFDEAKLGFIEDTKYDPDSVIYKKPGMLIHNSVRDMKLKINNTSINLQEPRYWNKHLINQHLGKTNVEKYLSTSGSSFPHWDGAYDVSVGYSFESALTNSRIINDKGIEQAAESVFQDSGPDQVNLITINFAEPLNIGCFYPQNTDYKKSFYRKMSPLIPYVRDIELLMNLDDLASNTLVYLYSRRSEAALPQPRFSVLTATQITNAELVLTWIKPRKLQIPRQVKIQSFYVDRRQFNLGDVDFESTVNASFNQLIIHQVPSYIFIYATVNKDDENYRCASISSSRDIAGLDQYLGPSISSQEDNMQIVSGTFRLRLNTVGGDDIIDLSYNNRELYDITLSNSSNDMPWNFRQWSGSEGRISLYPSQTYVILGEKDLNSYFVRKGQRVDNLVLDFACTYLAQGGSGYLKADGQMTGGGDKNYVLCVEFIYDRYYVQLSECGNTEFKHDSQFL